MVVVFCVVCDVLCDVLCEFIVIYMDVFFMDLSVLVGVCLIVVWVVLDVEVLWVIFEFIFLFDGVCIEVIELVYCDILMEMF